MRRPTAAGPPPRRRRSPADRPTIRTIASRRRCRARAQAVGGRTRKTPQIARRRRRKCTRETTGRASAGETIDPKGFDGESMTASPFSGISDAKSGPITASQPGPRAIETCRIPGSFRRPGSPWPRAEMRRAGPRGGPAMPRIARIDASEEVNRPGRHAVDLTKPAPKRGHERFRR